VKQSDDQALNNVTDWYKVASGYGCIVPEGLFDRNGGRNDIECVFREFDDLVPKS
jgi:hypothetical protein